MDGDWMTTPELQMDGMKVGGVNVEEEGEDGGWKMAIKWKSVSTTTF
jgi:glutaredoxin-related protein